MTRKNSRANFFDYLMFCFLFSVPPLKANPFFRTEAIFHMQKLNSDIFPQFVHCLKLWRKLSQKLG